MWKSDQLGDAHLGQSADILHGLYPGIYDEDGKPTGRLRARAYTTRGGGVEEVWVSVEDAADLDRLREMHTEPADYVELLSNIESDCGDRVCWIGVDPERAVRPLPAPQVRGYEFVGASPILRAECHVLADMPALSDITETIDAMGGTAYMHVRVGAHFRLGRPA